MSDITSAHVGRQVSPVSIADLCEYGMYGTVLSVTPKHIRVEWASGRTVSNYRAGLELVPLCESVRPDDAG